MVLWYNKNVLQLLNKLRDYMERKHYIIVGISIALALCPVFSLELLSVAIFGALLGMVALFWTMRSVDSEDRRLKSEIERVNREIVAAQEAQKAAEAKPCEASEAGRALHLLPCDPKGQDKAGNVFLPFTVQ